jgi:HlyD family secretion protein
MKIFKRILMVVLGLAIVAALVVASLPKPPEVDVAEVSRGDLRVTVDGDGKTRVQDRYVIAAPLYGNLARIELEPGDDVETGSVLARISPLDAPLLDRRSKAELEARVKAAQASRLQADAAIERAKAARDFAEKDRDRVRALAKDGNLPEQALDAAELEARNAIKTLESARFGARVAKHELEMAEAALGRLTDKGSKKGGDDGGPDDQMVLTAPVDGRVLKVIRESEGVVNQGEPLLEVGNASALEIVVDVLTQDAVEIEIGDPVVIERWGGENPLNGKVRLVEPSAFTKISALGVEEQRVNVVISIEESPEVWRRLGDGFRVEVSIEVWEGTGLLKIPAGSLHRMAGHWAVFVVEDGVVEERKVEIGRRSGLEVEVVEGLEAGDEVVVHPGDKIADGKKVAIR